MSKYHRITVAYLTDTYEFLINDETNTIVRITKTLGYSGMSRDCVYDLLPIAVKRELHKQIEQESESESES